MSDCIFCKIVSGDIPSEKVFESDKVLGFKDLHPQASEHYLFIHKEHTRDIQEMMSEDRQQVLEIFKAIKDFVSKQSTLKEGFRIVTNKGALGGQSVFHTHFHVLGGEQLRSFGA